MRRTSKVWSAVAAAGAACAAICAALCQGVSAQEPPALDVVQIRPGFHLIAGAGGNILVQIGPAGVVLVDSGSSARTDAVLATIRRLTPLPIRYILNTSGDLDHVGGNDRLASAGLSILPGAVAAGAGLSDDLITNNGGASVLAHENVLSRLSVPGVGEAGPPSAALLPTKTFAYGMYSMYMNGEGIQVIHQRAAHSDGDTIVFFRRADVIATGDVVDTRRFPVIDLEHGGSIQGELDALNALMQMSILNVPFQWQSDRTVLVPGHGRLYDKLDLLEYRDAVTIVRDRIHALVAQGKTLEQVVAADPALGYRSQYGSDTGPWTTERFVTAVYKSLAASSK